MRYIIFEKGAIQTPVVFPAFSEIKRIGTEVSRGECDFYPLSVTPINPRRAKEDYKLLKALFTNATKSSFLNEEQI